MAVSTAGCIDATDGGRSLFGLSLCAGVGGLDLGIHIAIPLYRTVGYVERDAYAAATLVARMADEGLGQAPIWDDVSTFDGKAWCGAVDIIHGGYPCQPFSVAGRKLGDKDPRHLWPHIARIVDEVRPPLCFFENVGGHLRLGFEQVHDDLRRMGYCVKAGLFTAEEVGASHKRERLFILAYRDSDRLAGHACATSGKNDPQGRTQRPAHAVTRRDSDAAERFSLHETGSGSGTTRSRLQDGEDPLADTTRTRTGQHKFGSRHQPERGQQGLADPTGMHGETIQRREPNGDRQFLGDANGEGLEGRNADLEQDGDSQQPFPPGPSDKSGWERYLKRAPNLEPSVCGGSDGLANRVDRLRLCGNGVVPLVAAHAFRTLAAAAIFNE